MTTQSTMRCPHADHFSSVNHQNERRIKYVLAITLVTMAVEVIAGTMYGSMALLADGWHMGTHAAAFCITLFTYHYAKLHAESDRFSYGVGKVSVLGGYTSAIALGIVAVIMLGESLHRLFSPVDIQFGQSILVAVIGLIVNLASMRLLGHDHSPHGHEHEHEHEHEHKKTHGHHQDHNLKAAYFHVLADALTSLLAIAALLIGKFIGWYWLDPLMGIVGAAIITHWALGLMKQTSPILLDENIDSTYRDRIIANIEAHPQTTVTDIHIWKVSADHYAASLVVKTARDYRAQAFKQGMQKFAKIDHLTIEVNYC